MLKETSENHLLPMREVVRLTGVNPITLRAWERRYGLIQPTRTDGGHRLYSIADVQTIQKIKAWTDRGVAVSKVAAVLDLEAAQQAELSISALCSASTATTSTWLEWQAVLRTAILRFDEDLLEHYYGQLFSIYSLQSVLQQIIMPVWYELLPQKHFGQHSQWLFYDDFLRNRLSQRLRFTRQLQRECVVFAMPENQGFELEVLVCALLFDNAQGRVRVLPSHQRLNELPLVCQSIQPKALVFFATTPMASTLLDKIRRVALRIDSPVALAGMGAELAAEALLHSPLVNLGTEPQQMQFKLEKFLAGRLDT